MGCENCVTKKEVVATCDKCGLEYITIGQSKHPKCAVVECDGNVVPIDSPTPPTTEEDGQ